MKLLTAAAMRELDRRAIEEAAVPGVVLMENAGRAVADAIARRYAALRPGPALVLAGKGNNGGDGFVVARHLLNGGWQVRTVLLADRETPKGDAAVHLRALLGSGGEVCFAPNEERLRPLLDAQQEALLVVDALLGTGLTAEVGGLYAAAVDWLNAARRTVVAVDLPSGVDADCGRVLGRAVRADLTVTFAFAKVGHAVYPGAALAGALEVADIGIPLKFSAQVADDCVLVEAADAAALLPLRPVTGHKGTFGHLLVVAGSDGKAGAAALTAGGGVRSGAGLVTVAAPASVQKMLAVKLTEAMTVPLSEVDGALSLQARQALAALWASKEALALGPGLGLAEETGALVRHVVRECPLPLVLDADGVNALCGCPELLLERPAGTVLTPHPGEMARLTGATVAEIEADRLGAALEFARRFQVVLVLKGARTVTAFPDGRVRLNGSGNPGLASGGMGDVLTGLIGGLLAQGLPPEAAAVLGVYLHGQAADRLAQRLGDAGMAASDLLHELPAARRELAANLP